jgi:putative copper export protein
MSGTILWLIRYGHVLSGAVWVGGYALLALVLIPTIRKDVSETLIPVTINAVRVLTYAGMLTIFFGILLITRTRGFANIFKGEWGALIVTCFVIAIALLGIGDAGLRPALRQLAATGDGRAARRFALAGLVLTILAIGFMTRALYAPS